MPAPRGAGPWALLALWLCGAAPVRALQCRDHQEPCLNRGTCVTYHNGTDYCKCPEGFWGEYCQHRDPCEKNRCQNGGTCVASAMLERAMCRCPPGFTGLACQYPTSHPCVVARPCLNGGTCLALSRDAYECTCKAGFTGKLCQWTDACLSQPCANGSTCVTVAGQFSCRCLAGFTGQKCETDVNECDVPGRCQHGGTCLNLPGSYQCQCPQGFTGQHCDSPYMPCAPSPCVNGGTCRQTSDFTFECNCLPGFEGSTCERNIDDCPNHRCQNGGVCVDGVNTYNCRCPPQWTGQFCTEDVDECLLQPNACQNGGTCTNRNGGYGCVCVNGWSGDDCSENIDDCAFASCTPGSTCIDRVASFSCMCPEGKAGLLCHLDDACISNPCHKGALCDTNPLNGQYICTCPQGYKGADCTEDVDECAMANSNPCEHAGKCVNTDGAFHCECLKGYAGPRCEMDINECHSDPCQNDATCLDKIGGFTCLCMPGKGAHDQIDECHSSPCVNDGRCIDLVNGFQCNCQPGTSGRTSPDHSRVFCYSHFLMGWFSSPCVSRSRAIRCCVHAQCCLLAGLYCEINFDDCASNPCVHGACVDGINRYSCVCAPGYTGQRCNIDIDECASSPCRKGATCVNDVNGFRCLCPEGPQHPSCYSQADECLSGPCVHGNCTGGLSGYKCLCDAGWVGINCEVDKNECLSSPCQNGGTCDDLLNGYRCTCKKGFKGHNCQVNTDECASNPCLNQGTCFDGINGYTCHCVPPYTGKNCQTVLAPCSPNPCENAAVCKESPNFESYTCLCAPGWQGQRCTVDIDECVSKPCMNHGLCHNTQGSYVCECLPGFSGVDCEEDVDDCLANPCQNGGSCVDGVNTFSCLCLPGFIGNKCQTDMNECLSEPCKNGGTCSDYVNSYTCTCQVGFDGVHCEKNIDELSRVPGPAVSSGRRENRQKPQGLGAPGYSPLQRLRFRISDFSAHQRVRPLQLTLPCLLLSSCFNGGTCVDGINSFSCLCPVGFTGPFCLHEINECNSHPCLNEGTCVDGLGTYRCNCPLGYTGKNCQYEVDECKNQPCQNGGTCIALVNHFKCSCPPGTRGLLCEENIDDCAGGPHCLNGGQCVDRIGGYSCRCLPGFAGERCEGDINECLSNPCSPEGSLDCVQLTNDYLCVCRSAFTGRHCETFMDVCPQMPCLNGGTCAVASNMPDGFICRCPPGFSGARCQSSCGQMRCRRGEKCVHTASGPRCFCPNPQDCEPGCASSPCQHGGSCYPQRQPPYYSCRCPPPFWGRHCELHAAASSAPPAACLSQYCADKARDGVCDEACNSHACRWDGGDCSLTVENPWANCSSPLPCWDHINHRCDELCNTAECLFDNFECQGGGKTCQYDKYCADHFKDNHCDQGCNSEECGWDGLDCAADRPENLAEGTLVIVVLLPPEQLLQDSRSFLRALGTLLHTNLRIKRDSQGALMVYPYYGEKPAAPKKQRMARRSLPEEQEQEVAGSKVFLEIDNRQCAQDSDQCFKNTDAAAALLASHAIQGTLSYPLVSVVSESLPPKGAQLLYLLAVAVVIILFVILLGVIMAKRKRKHGFLWLPEGFTLRRDSSNHKRREPVGQDAVGLKNLSVQASEANLIGSGTSEHWVDDEGPQPKKARAEDEVLLSEDDPIDRRPWTQQHLEAADIRRTPSLALTPPQAEQEVDVLDVNVRGPDGCTPLMLASLRGGSSDLSDEDEDAEDSSANIITDLVYQGASLQAQTDRTGEMALHLAARYSRADAAKRLLDAGADANAQDNMGRCPLHAAVAADAQGVFQILIRNRVTDLDARMNDGTTPLILAARLAVEGMVAELINCQADVNAVDDHGKSALHWAAAVNNVEATLVLLKNGANRDMQDNKEETPLFLAAREGSYEAAKILLDHFANRDITDHMDRLPRDVARDRMHHDIVRLLDEYNVTPSPPGTVLTSALSPVLCGPNRSFLSLKHAPMGKKPRRPNTKSAMPTSLPNLAKEPKDAKGGRRKKPLNDKVQLSESSVTLSPVDSLESPHTYVSDTTSSPVITSPGVLQASPNPLLATVAPPAPVHAQHALSFSSLHEMQPLAPGANTVLPSVSQLLSHHHVVPPGGGSAGGLGRLQPVSVPAEWMNRMEMNETHYNEMFGMVLAPTEGANPGIAPQSRPSEGKHITTPREHLPPIVTFQLIPKGSIAQSTGTPQSQSSCPPGPLPPMYQIPEMARLSSVAFPPAVIPQQDGQVAQTILPPYHPFPASVGKYPTPPSQHSYASSNAAERTPSHSGHLQGEHPYLTPSPESPDQWSSSSPHSASDWSDVTTSPTPGGAGGGQRGAGARMSEPPHSSMQVYA
uniref:Notch 2 n=1 Tax=Jaculus jaculus TaxID=51337 RepID=A0A8C5KFT1_JACJA